MSATATITEPVRLDNDPRGRMYRVPGGRVYPSVTNVLGAVPKPVLMYWAASQERKLVTRCAIALQNEQLKAQQFYGTDLFERSLKDKLTSEKEHEKILRKAADIGTAAHEYIEWAVRGQLGLERDDDPPTLTPESSNAVFAWDSWRHGANLQPIASERKTWSDELKVAGTVDLVGRIDWGGVQGLVAVADWKTSKAVYLEHRLQAAAYRQCEIERGRVDEKAIALVLRLSKTKVEKGASPFEAHGLTPRECDSLLEGFRVVRDMWEFLVEKQGVELR